MRPIFLAVFAAFILAVTFSSPALAGGWDEAYSGSQEETASIASGQPLPAYDAQRSGPYSSPARQVGYSVSQPPPAGNYQNPAIPDYLPQTRTQAQTAPPPYGGAVGAPVAAQAGDAAPQPLYTAQPYGAQPHGAQPAATATDPYQQQAQAYPGQQAAPQAYGQQAYAQPPSAPPQTATPSQYAQPQYAQTQYAQTQYAAQQYAQAAPPQSGYASPQNYQQPYAASSYGQAPAQASPAYYGDQQYAQAGGIADPYAQQAQAYAGQQAAPQAYGQQAYAQPPYAPPQTATQSQYAQPIPSQQQNYSYEQEPRSQRISDEEEPSFAAEPRRRSRGLYLGLKSGITLADDITTVSGVGIDSEYKTGWNLAGSLGYAFAPWAYWIAPRAEAELGYSRNSVDTHTIGGVEFKDPIAFGDMTTLNFMANGYTDFFVSRYFQPYLGGGFGMGYLDLDRQGLNATGVLIDNNNIGFAWQAGAGLNLPIGGGLLLDLGYRYLQSVNVKIESPAGNKNEITTGNHVIQLGLRAPLRF